MELQTKTAALRTVIQRGKRRDLFFSILGVLCLTFGLLTVLILVAQMGIAGLERLNLVPKHDAAPRLDRQAAPRAVQPRCFQQPRVLVHRNTSGSTQLIYRFY